MKTKEKHFEGMELFPAGLNTYIHSKNVHECLGVFSYHLRQKINHNSFNVTHQATAT